jgi:hypothetical protein
MKRMLGLALMASALVALPSSSPAGGAISGTWKLTVLARNGSSEATNWLFKLETVKGRTTAKLLGASPGVAKAGGALVSFNLTGDHVRLVVQANEEKVFEGRFGKDGKKIVGVFGTDQLVNAAYMAPTAMTKIEAKDVTHKLGIEEIEKVSKITQAAAVLTASVKETKDADEKAKLQKEAEEANQEATVEVPKLLRETIANHAGSYAAGRAGLMLLQRKNLASTPAELKGWGDLASKSASAFGPIWSAEVNNEIATALLNRKNNKLAADFARLANKALDQKSSVPLQIKVLDNLETALKNAGAPPAEQAQAASRLNVLNAGLDAEYLSTLPPFKGKKFAGRKGRSDRAVVLELFTGADCPFCTGAEVAFDFLQKTYRINDLILIQYHLHIPGPDPMTNTATLARANFYGVNSTPTPVLNGAKKGFGGGGMEATEQIYENSCRAINPLLESPAECKITASAKRQGDKIEVQANVTGVEKPGKKMKLRLVLAEETVLYVGGNRVRLHHQVVRAMPGSAAGVPIVNSTLSVKQEVDLSNLRERLLNYLDDFAAKNEPFSRPGRPLSMERMCAIAFVQDDATHEILQAVQVPVVD